MLFCLVDCNNFFVSCELVFNPKLNNKPVVVLSSNDGCIVSRSNQAKKLGIPMGAPKFKYQDEINRHGIKTFSSNFSLYADFSWRVMSALRSLCDQVEVYSVDEAFLRIDSDQSGNPTGNQSGNLFDFGSRIVERVARWTGIPVSVGIAPSKTLAKAANEYAKRYRQSEKVMVLVEQDKTHSALKELAVQDVWGVGWRSARTLNAYGIETAFDLEQARPSLIRRKFNVILARTQLELQGQDCSASVGFRSSPDRMRKTMIVSRSFSKKIREYAELEEAVCSYVSRAAQKLRKEKIKTDCLSVFIKTSYYGDEPTYSNSIALRLERHTNDTQKLLVGAQDALKKIFKSGYAYKKAGVQLTSFLPEDLQLGYLFTDSLERNEAPQSYELMKTVDYLNNRHGSDLVRYAATGLERKWTARADQRSPERTAKWGDLLGVG